MGFFPNKLNSEKLFKFIKKNENDTLFFEEFLHFMELVMNGGQDKKIDFIFDFINFPKEGDEVEKEQFQQFFEM